MTPPVNFWPDMKHFCGGDGVAENSWGYHHVTSHISEKYQLKLIVRARREAQSENTVAYVVAFVGTR